MHEILRGVQLIQIKQKYHQHITNTIKIFEILLLLLTELLLCQQNLLQTELKKKKTRLRILKNEFNRLHNHLQLSLNGIDFAHIS